MYVMANQQQRISPDFCTDSAMCAPGQEMLGAQPALGRHMTFPMSLHLSPVIRDSSEGWTFP